MLKNLVLTAVALSVVPGVWAKDIFVSSKGDDKNAGTAQAPFATIAHAASKARPGDVVKIAPGLYREQITFRKSGTKNAPITFAGSRGPKGEFLTIIEPTGTTLTKWSPAPEVAPGVWKTPLEKQPHDHGASLPENPS